jgi:hypothetical protein
MTRKLTGTGENISSTDAKFSRETEACMVNLDGWSCKREPQEGSPCFLEPGIMV